MVLREHYGLNFAPLPNAYVGIPIPKVRLSGGKTTMPTLSLSFSFQKGRNEFVSSKHPYMVSLLWQQPFGQRH